MRNVTVATVLVGTALLTGSTLSYYEEAPLTTMNPLFAQSLVDVRSQELVFDRLVYRSAITHVHMSRLADLSTAQRLDEGRALKLKLKPGIRWHDGETLGADDVCFTVAAMLDPQTPSQVARGYRESLAGCEALPKEHAVVLRFTKAYHNPLDRVGFSVLPKHAFASTAIRPDADFSARPVGTGPMKGTFGQTAKFTAVPNAHHVPNIQVVTQRGGGDPVVQVHSVISGSMHGMVNLPPMYRAEIASVDDAALKSYDLRSWWFVAVNTNRGALREKAVRQALDTSLDRSDLRDLTIGFDPRDPSPPVEFVSGPFVGSSPYYNRAIKPHERSDRAKARELLLSAGAREEAGRWVLGGKPILLKIGIYAPLDAEAPDLLNQLGNQLAAAGFDRQVYKISADEWSRRALSGQLADDYDLLVGKWSFGLVEDVNALFHTRGGEEGALNLLNYSSPTVDGLLARYDAARTDTEAQDAYHALHATLADELPYLFLWKLDTKSAWRTEVRGNVIAPYYYFTEFDGWAL